MINHIHILPKNDTFSDLFKKSFNKIPVQHFALLVTNQTKLNPVVDGARVTICAPAEITLGFKIQISNDLRSLRGTERGTLSEFIFEKGVFSQTQSLDVYHPT